MAGEITFLSEQWVKMFKQEVQKSASYKEAAKTWEGDLDLIIQAEPKAGIESDVHLYMDLWHGDCRDIKLVSKEEGRKAEFIIAGSYDRWKQVVKEELEPIKGMMQGKLKLKGDLPYIVRHVQAAKELVICTTRIPTRFTNE